MTGDEAIQKKEENVHGRHVDTNGNFTNGIISTISQKFASPEGERFPQSPKETLTFS